MPTYYVADGEHHTRRRCRRLHRTSDRITRTDTPDGDPCPRCVAGDDTMQARDIEQLIQEGVCPWCEDYAGEHVGQHASSAHPDEWQAYRE